jgi:hypothetical protein
VVTLQDVTVNAGTCGDEGALAIKSPSEFIATIGHLTFWKDRILMRYRLLTGLVCAAIAVGANMAEAAQHRAVEIRWDFRLNPPGQLEVWVDCARKPNDDIYDCADANKIKAPASYSFRLQRTDTVTLVVISEKTGDPGFATYAITGTNLDEKDLDALKKLFGAEASAAAKSASGSPGLTDNLPEPKADIFAVTDDLVAGGKLTVTFALKKTVDGKETTTKTTGPLSFLVQSEPPRVTVSVGLGFSTAPTPAVEIAKTSTIVTFEKDGKPQQAYQQVIQLQDNDESFKPIQSMMILANFRLVDRIYASVGVQVNQKLFESPLVGGTYRIPLGGRRGLNFTAGVIFSRELMIAPETGWAAGQVVDPTIGLTVSDIKTTHDWHVRPAAAFSIDF